jgi:hypothetical protein
MVLDAEIPPQSLRIHGPADGSVRYLAGFSLIRYLLDAGPEWFLHFLEVNKGCNVEHQSVC